MGATTTRVNTRGRRRGTRQRAAAGSLPSFCPALCLTPGLGFCVPYVALSGRRARRARVNGKVNARVNHNFFEPFTLAFTRQHRKRGFQWD